MKTALKNFIDHPLMAPVTDAVTEMLRLPGKLWHEIITDTRNGFRNSQQAGESFLESCLIAYGGAVGAGNEHSARFGFTSLSLVGGAVIGAGIAGSLAPAGFFITTGALIAGLALGGATGPALIGVPLQAATWIAGGILCAIPKFLYGCEKAIIFAVSGRAKYDTIMQTRLARKNGTAPATPPQKPAVPATDWADQIANMSPTERKRAIDELQQKFGDDFDAARVKSPAETNDNTKALTETAPMPDIKKKPFAPGKKA